MSGCDLGSRGSSVVTDPGAGASTMRGSIRQVQMRPGLFAHSTDVLDLQGSTIQVMLTRQFHVVLVLDGEVDVAFGSHDLSMAVDCRNRRSRAEGALIALPEPTLFTRRAYRGKRERKVSISASADWLAASGLCFTRADCPLESLCGDHLAIARWRPSAKVVALAEQIHSPPAYALPLQKLYMESRAIEILTEAFLAVSGADGTDGTDGTESAALRPRDELRMRELRDFLDEDAAAGLSMEAIASHVGSNPSTLQRNFRTVFGMTVFKYLRERKLRRAREALERGGVSVAEAADIAGYGSAANFATAYRRCFGITPGQSRAWV
jgi:AraC-like DNA-binding protein